MLQRPTVARLTYAIVLVFPLLSTTAAAEPDVKWAIVVHGGAGSGRTLPPEDIAARKAAMRKAIMAGREILAEGGAAIDAVQQVIQILEDDPLFNAGRGAVLNSQGGHELDASIMDGRTKQCGAVAGVTTVKNPILLARRVMTETRHVLLVAERNSSPKNKPWSLSKTRISAPKRPSAVGSEHKRKASPKMAPRSTREPWAVRRWINTEIWPRELPPAGSPIRNSAASVTLPSSAQEPTRTTPPARCRALALASNTFATRSPTTSRRR